ncbi:MAG: hypothetical protein ACE5R6_15860 [Candidatus Heimdallarchaeota archaeon]
MTNNKGKICVDPDFFDVEIYAIYYAAYDLLGDDAWKIVWKSGEIVFNEIKEKIGAATAKSPFEALRKVADWLKKVGYIEEIEVREVAKDELEYVMCNPIILTGAKRLIKEGRVPAHISTALMFAVLKQYNMKAEMVGDPKFLPDGRAIEKWRLFQTS